MTTIDLNCDMGESFGAWTMGQDADVLRYVSSANIACGFHAGDPQTMRRTVAAAIERGVAIGAHPSLPDLAGFGRREMRVSAEETHALTLYQIGALAAMARAAGARLHHVKPHGALYNMAARDRALADAIAAAVRDFDATLILVGLAGSELPRAGERVGLAVAQAIGIASRGEVAAANGTLRLRADTICVHGDRPNAATFAQRLREGLERSGIAIAPMASGSRA